MSEAAAELSVVIKGKEVGLKSLLAALERDLKQTDRAAEKTAGAVGNGLASAEQRAANSALTLAAAQARLARAQGDTAGATTILKNALEQNAAAGQRSVIAVQTQIAGLERLNSSGAALPRTFAGLTTEMQSLAASTLSVGAGIGVAVAAAQSFADAFNFKAELDATTASVNIQLKGVRDSGQVWAEAASFANQYKLTQAETTATVQASIGILRQSKSSVEDTFGVLQRLTVLAPGKSIQDAAFSVRELASGDITSIAEQFNISRGRATEMRDAIREGADVVQVLSQFLSEAGVSMDTLKIRTEGALGAQKELAIAQEQLKLAQAEFAQGPGLQILNTQITATTGLTRVLTSDFASMGESLRAATADNNPFVNWITGATVLQAGLDALTGSQQAQTEAALAGTTGGELWGQAAQQAAVAATEVDAATQAAASAFADEAIQKQLSADKAQILADMQQRINDLAGPVSAGIISNAGAAGLLAQEYGIATAAAQLLIAAQARVAGGEARLASQKGQTRDLVPGGVGFNAPGRKGGGDADVIATVTAAQRDNAKASDEAAAAQRRLDEARGGSKTTIANLRKDLASATVGSAAYIDTLAKIEAAEKAAAKTGAGAGKSRVDQAKKTNEELIKATEDYHARIAQIDKDGAAKRLEAENSLKQAQLSGRAAFYASLAGIDDQALRQDLSARYESAAQAAAKIAETQGADAAEAYLAASQQQIEGEAKLQEQIAKERADGNTGQADYLQGVLDLQKAANAEELRQIQEKGSAVNNAQAAQYSEAERQYAEHLDRMNGIAASKGVAPGSATTTTTATAAPAAASSRAQPVQDVATPPAIDSQTARLGGLLGEVITAVNVVAERVSSVERAIGGLKQSRATAGG